MAEQARERPLSPHLQVYNLPLTARISILHRIMGVALSGGLFLLVYWLWALAMGQPSYQQAQAIFGSWLGLSVLLGFSFALFLHLSHGIRHLIWDAGVGLNKVQTQASDVWVLLATGMLTALAWMLGWLLA